tara:strand:+ start:175 stop:948 length:774 start_codon:yes stop_codon:yes gene_type:complete
LSKNDIKIGESHPIDENLRPVKVGGETTALELSKDKVRTKVLDAGDLTASSFSPTTLSVGGDATIGNDLTVGNSLTTTEDITCGDDFTITGGVIKLESANFSIYKVVGQDTIRIVVGGAPMLNLMETSTGNHIQFYNSAVGFNQRNYGTLDATDSYLTFRDCNKWTATFPAANVTDMHLYFPDVSCNCTLLLTQDSVGSRTITNWKTYDQAAGNESTVKWAGGTAPTLTTTANKTDILSFYWDNDNHKAYGVASLNF